jgi:iron(III) transport system ATP-binding protein
MIKIANVTKKFGTQTALSDVSLTIPAGAITSVLGPSGCGKTTLLRIIAGFERPDSGTIDLGNGPATHLPPEQRNIGYVAQEGALFPHLTVAKNISFGLPLRERRASSRAKELLELVGLPTSYANRHPHELSGGQQQRVSLARALAPTPNLVLLDEPFSALDTGLREETRTAVAKILKEVGATAILVTHDQAEALSLSEQIAVLNNGTLLQTGIPENLYHEPVNQEVATFLGDTIILNATHPLGKIPLRGTGTSKILLRPEQLEITETGAPTRLISRTFYGPHATLLLELPDGQTVTLRTTNPTLPTTIRLSVRGTALAF